MFLFFDFPNSTLGELAGARVGSQGKQRTGPRPCNNIKVLVQRKNMKKVNKKYQTKSANRSSTLQFSSELPNVFFTSQKAMKISPKKTANRSTALQFSIKSQSCFFLLKSHSCFFPIKYSFIIGKETNLQAHIAPFLTSVGSEMLVMS